MARDRFQLMGPPDTEPESYLARPEGRVTSRAAAGKTQDCFSTVAGFGDHRSPTGTMSRRGRTLLSRRTSRR